MSFLVEKYMVTDVIAISYRNPLINEWAISSHLRTNKAKKILHSPISGNAGGFQSKWVLALKIKSLLIGGCG